MGGANGGSEIAKMRKDYFKGMLNSESSANGSTESVEHSINCKENYLVLEMRMCSFVSLASLLQKLSLNKAPGPDCISAEHLLYEDESLRFFLSELFNMCIVHGYIPVTKRPIDANIQRVYLLGFKEVSFNILETRK